MTDPHGVRIALALILGLLAFPTAAAAAADETRIIVGRDPGLSAADRADIRADAGVTLAERLPLANTEVVTADPDRARAALRRLNADPDVRYAELDRIVHAFAPDTYFDFQWALENTGQSVPTSDSQAPAYGGTADADMDVAGADSNVWATSTGLGHTVAVVDTGILATHEDLVGHVAAGLDWVSQDATPEDPKGHGTHVSGTIAATADNGAGVAGVAPDSRVLPLRVLDAKGNGRTSDVVAAFVLAGQLGVKVVNASLGSGDSSQAEQEAIHAASGTLFVVSAGNDGAGGGSFPCAYPEANVLCVGASDQDDQPAAFSNFNATDVDVFAPGVSIVSTWNDANDGYAVLDGTSMAAPQVSGIAALLLGKNPQLATSALKAAILDTVDLSSAFAGKALHAGRVNATAALAAVTAPAACTVNCADPDQDGVTGAQEKCPDEAGTGADGCIAITAGIADGDSDGKIDRFDLCPASAGRPSDGCPDRDGDGVADLSDACPDTPGTLANGCSVPVVVPPPPDRDGDGRPDALDACPAERAVTPDGCPVPVARSVAVKVIRWSRRVTLRVRSDRVATASFQIDRRTCNRHGRSCRWKRVASRRLVTSDNVAAFSKRLARGSYRGSVTLSSSSGSTRPIRRTFKVR
jgi:subtilisin family serine protease